MENFGSHSRRLEARATKIVQRTIVRGEDMGKSESIRYHCDKCKKLIGVELTLYDGLGNVRSYSPVTGVYPNRNGVGHYHLEHVPEAR